MNRNAIILLLITPVFWLFISTPFSFFREWSRTGMYVRSNLKNTFAVYNMRFISDMRSSLSGTDRNPEFARLLFNKGTYLFQKMTEDLKFLSPKYYFSNSIKGSGVDIEAIPMVFFPFWILGIVQIVKRKKFLFFLLPLPFVFLIFLSGQQNIYFISPISVIYLYYIFIGLKDGDLLIRNIKEISGLNILIYIYSLILFTRFIFL